MAAMDDRPGTAYEALPAQGGQVRPAPAAAPVAAGNSAHDASSRRSSLSASSGDSDYLPEIGLLPDGYFGNFGVSPASSRGSREQEIGQPGQDDYLPVSRSSSDHTAPAEGFWDGRRSLEEAGGQQSAETLVENAGAGKEPQVDDDEIVGKPDIPPGPWTPLYLRKVTVVGFLLIYVALLVALVVLGVVDQKHQGLANSTTSRHYLWTYGPTAVLTIVAAFWGQVEHRTKQMMPWAILRKGPSPAADTLLIDYIEPARPVSLYKSLKNAHWPVSIAIVGTLLLQLLTVTSTGLFQLQSETLNHTGVALLYGRNLSYPSGTSEKLAFPELSLKHGIPGGQNLSIASTVDVFHAGLNCEVVDNPKWNDDCFAGSSFYGDCKSAMPKVNFTTSSCRIENLEMGIISGASQAGVYGAAVAANCTDSPSDHRLVMAMIRYGIGRNYTGELPETSSPQLSMEPAPILVCQPSYAIDAQSIVMDDSGSLVSAGPQNASTAREAGQLPISQWDLVENILQSVSNASNAASGPANEIQDIGSDGSTRSMLDDFMYCVTAFLNPNNITDLLDIGLLQKETERFYSTVSAQMAKDYLMVSSDKEVSGEVAADQQRLRIRGLSFYMMEAILALLIVVAAALYFIAPRNNTNRDPGSIGGLAAIMTGSPSLRESLSRCGSAGLSTLRERLSNYRALSSLQESDGKYEFRVVMVPEDSISPGRVCDEESAEDKIRWWKPLAMSRITKTGVTLYLLLLVAALESTYQASVKHDGLANVETESYVRYTWVYVPALTMFIAQLLVGMIGDVSKILAPFQELRRKDPVPIKALFSDPLSQLTVQTVVKAIPSKQYALLAASLAMLLTPLLTIVASGLFSPETSAYSQAVTAKFDDAFNLTYATTTMQSSFIIGLLLQSNLSYPAWTHGELAVPQLHLSTDQNTGSPINASQYPSFNGSTVSLTVPAVPRASLNCTYLPPGQVSVYNADDFDYTQAATPLLSAANSDCLDLYSKVSGNYSRAFGWTQSVLGSCGVIRGVYGPSTTSNSSAQGFACAPSIEQVHVNLTLRLPSYTIEAAVALEDTATPYQTHGWDWNNFDLAAILPGAGYTGSSSDASSSSSPSSSSSSSSSSNDDDTTAPLADFDPVFQAILATASSFSSTTLPPTALFGPSAFPLLTQSLEHIFRLAFAQVVNLEFRVPVDDDTSTDAQQQQQQQLVNATLTDPHRLRLKQSALSTRILEGLLGAVAACLVASFAAGRGGREVLPKCPCSVAAGASLVADAGMVRRDGGVGGGGGRRKEDGEGEEEGFSMGFWGERGGAGAGGSGRRRWFGVDRGRAAWE
ncbi:hypothetical protein SLS55_007132 [Diplodia seriata]|uniref:Uncharacterized protein n=1 Tax=Diplodia seriata TaxID=420778 RepID=A0ABR3CET2_9PEZI